MCMRHFVNAANGYSDKSRERWEQARMIAWYSAFDRKPFKQTDIAIPGERHTKKPDRKLHVDRDKAYQLLEKWNK